VKPVTAAALLAFGREKLRVSGNAQPGLDARILLQHALGCDHAGLISVMTNFLEASQIRSYSAMLERRCRHEPVWRIIGKRSFYGLELAISPDVLDPRPETELLVDRILGDYAKDDRLLFADIGTGSGAIAIALLRHLPHSECIAVDINAQALEIALGNAQSLGVAERFKPHKSNYLEALDTRFDFIVTNPPYITSAAIAGLEPEVCSFDPLIALDGGADGLDAYRTIFADAKTRLVDGGKLYLEIGAGQYQACQKIAYNNGWRSIDVFQDLCGINRVIVAAMQ
jgi:release factor glutamine methyltransferase